MRNLTLNEARSISGSAGTFTESGMFSEVADYTWVTQIVTDIIIPAVIIAAQLKYGSRIPSYLEPRCMAIGDDCVPIVLI